MKSIKIILLTIMLLIFSSTTFAWYSQPELIGEFRYDNNRDTGFHFMKADSNQGTRHYSKVRQAYTDGFTHGLATFDNGKLFVYYKYSMMRNLCKIGEEKNWMIAAIANNKLYKIVNDKNRVYYLMTIAEGEGDRFVLLGKRANGKYTIFVDSDNISQRYLGTESVMYEDVTVNDDYIMVGFSIFSRENITRGRIRMYWDASDNWFRFNIDYDK